MEFFLNGRCKSLPLSGIVWSVPGGREEQDARAVRNQSAKALISWRHEAKASIPSIVRLVFIVDSCSHSPRGNCRSVVSRLRIFFVLFLFYFFFSLLLIAA